MISLRSTTLFVIFFTVSLKLLAGSEDYTDAPPFVETNVGKPNVVIALDISGSMKATAYRDVNAGNWSKSITIQNDFDPSNFYFGYFETDKKYSYDTALNKEYFREDSAGNWDGNFLNWMVMRRIDVARKVLVGGKVIDRDGSPVDGEVLFITEGQNEPLDRTFRKTYTNTKSVTPFPNNTTFFIGNGGFSEDSTVARLSNNVEIGKFSLSRDTGDDDGDGVEDAFWFDVSFANNYSAPPVVVVSAVSFNGSHQVHARVKNVTATGFQVSLEEWAYLDGNHTSEDIVYIAAEEVSGGTTVKIDGQNYQVVADRVLTSSTTPTYDTISLQNAFSAMPMTELPVVFAGVSSYVGTSPVVARVRNVMRNSFDVTMFEEEASDGVHYAEDLHWIAFQPLQGHLETGQAILIGDTGTSVTQNWFTQTFPEDFFNTPPLIAANAQTVNDADTAYPRYGNGGVSVEQVTFKMEEEKSLDNEQTHAAENIGFIALESVAQFKIRVATTVEPKGVIQANAGSIRFGLAVYNYDHSLDPTSIYDNNTVHGGTLRPCYPDVSKDVADRTNFDICLDTHVKAPLENILDVIEDHPLIWGATPIAETLYEIKGYFEQDNRNRNGHVQWYENGTEGLVGLGSDGAPKARNSYEISDAWDPFYADELSATLPCTKSFVLHINDGAPFRDFDGDASEHPVIPNDGVGAYGQNEMLDDLALQMRGNDCRQENGMNGHQDISTYYVFAALGEGEANDKSTKRMREAAANGGFEDGSGPSLNTPDPMHPSDFIAYINSGGCAVNEWDSDADCSPDNFYFANDGATLVARLNEAFEDVTRRTGAGGAASVVSASRNGEGAIYYALFDPLISKENEQATWVGDVHSLMVDDEGNLRSDDGDKVLESTASDRIIDMCTHIETGDVRVKFSTNESERPTAIQRLSCSNNIFTAGLDDVGKIWSASQWLSSLTDEQVADSQRSYTSISKGRYIFTGIDQNADGQIFASETVEFMPDSFNVNSAGLIADSLDKKDKIIQYIRGEDIEGFRNRTIDGETLRLGDIIYATPTVVGRPSENLDLLYGSITYKNFFNRYIDRRQVVYSGGNDGLLHAFNGGWYNEENKLFKPAKGSGAPGSTLNFNLGAELWAYAPYNGLPHLEYLTNNNYGKSVADHLIFVDLPLRIFDARIFNADADHPDGWGTVMVAGMRLGGGGMDVDVDISGKEDERTLRSSYMIFDVTNPDKPPRMLMEFTHPDLGFTIASPTPIVAGTDHEGAGQWYLLMGSGPDIDAPGFEDVKSTRNAKLFLLDLKAIVNGSSDVLVENFGEDGILTLPEANSFISSMVVADFDLDNFTSDAVYFGTVSGEENNWSGKLYRMVLQESVGMPTLATGTWTPKVFYDPARPIIAPVTLASDKKKNRWVFMGSGRYLNRVDNADTNDNVYVGLKEPRNNQGIFTYSAVTKLANITSTEVNAANGILVSPPTLTPPLPEGSTFTTLKKRLAQYGNTTEYMDGWFRQLAHSERIIGAGAVLGGALNFTSYKPEVDGCKVSGESRLYVLDGGTGTAGYPAILNQSETALYNAFYVDIGQLPSTSPSIHIGEGYTTIGKSKTIVQSADGSIQIIETNSPNNIRSGEAAWRQLQQ